MAAVRSALPAERAQNAYRETREPRGWRHSGTHYRSASASASCLDWVRLANFLPRASRTRPPRNVDGGDLAVAPDGLGLETGLLSIGLLRTVSRRPAHRLMTSSPQHDQSRRDLAASPAECGSPIGHTASCSTPRPGFVSQFFSSSAARFASAWFGERRPRASRRRSPRPRARRARSRPRPRGQAPRSRLRRFDRPPGATARARTIASASSARRAASLLDDGVTSRFEYPVAGSRDGQLLVGYVDFLAVGADGVRLVDFKTAPAPSGPADVPPGYARQVATYATLLCDAGIAAGLPVRAGLLFTATGSMVWFD